MEWGRLDMPSPSGQWRHTHRDEKFYLNCKVSNKDQINTVIFAGCA